MPHDVRDLVVDFVRRWSEKAEIGVGRFIPWLGVTASKFYDWRQRYGCVNEHNGWVPRDFWLEPWEKEAIIEFHLRRVCLWIRNGAAATHRQSEQDRSSDKSGGRNFGADDFSYRGLGCRADRLYLGWTMAR